MLFVSSATFGGGAHWRGTRAAARVAASRVLSYCRNPGLHPTPGDWPGLQHAQFLATETPNGRKPLAHPQLRRRVDTTLFGPTQCLFLAVFALSSQYLPLDEIHSRFPWVMRVYTLEDSEDFNLPSLWITLCDTSPRHHRSGCTNT